MADDVEDNDSQEDHEVPGKSDGTESSAEPSPETPVTEETQSPQSDSEVEPLVADPVVAAVAVEEIDSEELPEWEELTPELLEDECLRGDFMLRWATILLAVLMGWSYLTETSVLVEIKTGEYLLDHGIAPPRTDPFAASTNDTPWVNLGWLTNLTVGAVYRYGGIDSLTVLAALKIGLTFWILSRISFPNVTTWWPSICAGIATVAAFPIYQPGTLSVTILGLSLMLLLLHRLTLKPDSSSMFALPVMMVFWANMDSRAWIGIAFLLVYTLISLMTHPLTRRQAIVLIASMLLPTLVHPWPLQPALGFQQTMAAAVETQAQGDTENLFGRYAIGMKNPAFWQQIDAMLIAQTTLIVLAFVAIFLNASRLHWGTVIAWMGVNGLAMQYGEIVPYAAIVNCVVASLQGQDWYRNSFSMEYKVSTWSVFFSRTGRAVTVMTFFAIAYGTINGFLFGVEGRRIGMGLDPRVENRIASVENDLLEGIYGDNVFNVRADQGDMLIWLGRRPYIDSRHALFVNAEPNLAEKHRAIRLALFPPENPELIEEADQLDWAEELEQAEIFTVMLRLWGDQPAYVPFSRMFMSSPWVMTGLGAAGAVFTRNDLPDDELLAHLSEHNQTNFFATAFQKNKISVDKLKEQLPTWPNAPSDYDRWLIQKLTVRPNSIQVARHYFQLSQLLSQQPIDVRVIWALAELSQQNVVKGIQEKPNSALGYRILRESQLILGAIEQQLTGRNEQLPMRVRLATYAAHHAVRAGGDAPADLLKLFELLTNQNSLDLAAQIAERYQKKTGKKISASQTDDPEIIKAGDSVLEQIDEQVAIVEEQVASARAEGAELGQLLQIASNGGCPGLALSILEEDLTLVASNALFQLEYARLLLLSGRVYDAWQQLENMKDAVAQAGPTQQQYTAQWRDMTGYANLGMLNPMRAIELWSELSVEQNFAAVKQIVSMPPISSTPAMIHDVWPAYAVGATLNGVGNFPNQWATLQLQNAFVHLDYGLVDEATADLERILEIHPEYPFRSLVVITLATITGKEYDLNPPSDQIPVWEGMFADDEPVEEDSSPAEKNENPAEKRSIQESANAPDSSPKNDRPDQPELPKEDDE